MYVSNIASHLLSPTLDTLDDSIIKVIVDTSVQVRLLFNDGAENSARSVTFQARVQGLFE